jgi:hypothetical protein
MSPDHHMSVAQLGYTRSQLEEISGDMATRSTIGVLNADQSVTAIYCHFDGYVDHNGHILKDNYTDPVKIQTLMALGALSQLGPEIGEKQDFDSSTNRDWCLAYGRDRGESDVDAQQYASVEDWLSQGEGYDYLWDGAEWLVNTYHTHGELRSLIQVILETNKDHD